MTKRIFVLLLGVGMLAMVARPADAVIVFEDLFETGTLIDADPAAPPGTGAAWEGNKVAGDTAFKAPIAGGLVTIGTNTVGPERFIAYTGLTPMDEFNAVSPANRPPPNP